MAGIDKDTRAAIFKRDGRRCRKCGSPDDLTIDHIMPRSRGGTNHRGNLQTLCKPCNIEKGDALPGHGDVAGLGPVVAVIRDGEIVRAPLGALFPALVRKKRRR